MLRALALVLALLAATPALAWQGEHDTDNHGNGPGVGPSQDQGGPPTDRWARETTLDLHFNPLPELGRGRNKTCPNCRTDRLQDDPGGIGHPDSDHRSDNDAENN